MPRETVVSVSGLVVEYGRTRAVDGISFEVRRGEVFGLLGTNGAGKTTTLDVLEGLRPATAGSVRLLGADPLVDHDRISPRIGIMLQDAGFFEELTVAQTIRSWRRFHRDPRSAAESLSLVGLEHRADVRVKQLSGGERRRLDLALAVLGHPEVLFLDEPTTGMDPEGRRRCLEIVRDLVRDGLTVVLTTHYLQEAEELADRIAIMHRGRMEVQGTLDEVLRAHGHSTISFESVTTDSGMARLLDGMEASTRRTGPTIAARIESTSPQTDLSLLLARADEQGLALDAIDVSRSSLEDLFLSFAHDPATLPGARP
jgi:ABC-2 type transport system ATP-binding protein